MKSYIEKLFTELPSFVSTFVNGLVQPSSLIEQAYAHEDESDVAARGIRFFIVAEIIVLVLHVAMPQWSADRQLPSTDSALVGIAADIVVSVFTLAIATALAMVAFRIVGHHVVPKRFIGMVAHVVSIGMVLTALLNSMTNIAKVDPDVARYHAEADAELVMLAPHMARAMQLRDSVEKGHPITQTDSLTTSIVASLQRVKSISDNLAQQPMMLITTSVVAIATFAVDIWIVAVGFLYARRNSVSTLRYAVAVALSLLFAGILRLAIGAAQLGSVMQGALTQ